MTTWVDLASGLVGTTYTHSGLTGGTNLYYRIRANNKYGSATSYSAASAMVTTSQPPDTPAKPIVDQDGTFITIVWSLPFENHASVIGYKVYINDDDSNYVENAA